MSDLFQCPDCNELFLEPAAATYVLAVRCSACQLAADLDDGAATMDLPAAA